MRGKIERFDEPLDDKYKGPPESGSFLLALGWAGFAQRIKSTFDCLSTLSKVDQFLSKPEKIYVSSPMFTDLELVRRVHL